MTENRPYTFELAAMMLDQDVEELTKIRNVARRNGINVDHLDRAAEILIRVRTNGEDIRSYIHREYLTDGWIHGYVSVNETGLNTWTLAQLAEAYHRSPAALDSANESQEEPDATIIDDLEALLDRHMIRQEDLPSGWVIDTADTLLNAADLDLVTRPAGESEHELPTR